MPQHTCDDCDSVGLIYTAIKSINIAISIMGLETLPEATRELLEARDCLGLAIAVEDPFGRSFWSV